MARRAQVLAIVGTVLLTVYVGALPATRDAAADPSPTLLIDAPEQVQVGRPIAVTLTVTDAGGIGGYETNVLFDIVSRGRVRATEWWSKGAAGGPRRRRARNVHRYTQAAWVVGV